MATLKSRLLALEQVSNSEPMLVLEVDSAPDVEQTALIDRCAQTGRRLLVLFMPGDTVWIPGCGVAPWEV